MGQRKHGRYRFCVFLIIIIGLITTPSEAQELEPAPPTGTSQEPAPLALTAPTQRSGFPRAEPNEGFFSSPLVVNLYGTRERQILTADSTGCIWGFDVNGAVLPGFPWRTEAVCDNTPRINNALAAGDIDGDGRVEIVAGTRGWEGDPVGRRGKVWAWNHDGTLLPGWPKEIDWNGVFSPGNRAEVYTIMLANLVGDRRPEIIAGTSNEAPDTMQGLNLYAWTADGQPVAGYPTHYKGAGIFGHIAATNLDNDAYADIIVGRDHIYVHAYDENGQHLPGWPHLTYLDPALGEWGRDKYIEYTRSGPATGDIDNDGSIEVVIAGKVRDPQMGWNHPQTTSALLVLEANGTRANGWTVGKTVGAPIGDEFKPNTPVVIANLNATPQLEIVVTYDDGTIRAYDYLGNQLWVFNYAQGRRLFASEVAIADVTGDRVPDIVFGTYNYEPYINSDTMGAVRLWALTLDGHIHTNYPVTLNAEGTNYGPKGLMAGPTIVDLDGNCTVEIIAHSRAGHLYVWNTPGVARPDLSIWPTARRDLYRRGGYYVAPRTSGVPGSVPDAPYRFWLPFVAQGCF